MDPLAEVRDSFAGRVCRALEKRLDPFLSADGGTRVKWQYGKNLRPIHFLPPSAEGADDEPGAVPQLCIFVIPAQGRATQRRGMEVVRRPAAQVIVRGNPRAPEIAWAVAVSVFRMLDGIPVPGYYEMSTDGEGPTPSGVDEQGCPLFSFGVRADGES